MSHLYYLKTRKHCIPLQSFRVFIDFANKLNFRYLHFTFTTLLQAP